MEGQTPKSTIAGNFENKFGSSNPLQRFLIKRFSSQMLKLVTGTGANTVLDVGCGEGYPAQYLRRSCAGIEITGVDWSEQVVRTAKRMNSQIGFQVASVYELPFASKSFDLVMALEVLEHLLYPEQALAEMGRVAQKYCLVSVPEEPLWRILNVSRGKFLASWGNTPGHLQHWSKSDFLRLLQRSFRVEQVATPFPWTMALCRADLPNTT